MSETNNQFLEELSKAFGILTTPTVRGHEVTARGAQIIKRDNLHASVTVDKAAAILGLLADPAKKELFADLAQDIRMARAANPALRASLQTLDS